MALAILLPVVALSVIALAILLRAEREAGQRGARETARAIALAIDREIFAAESALRVLSKSPSIVARDYDTFTRIAASARTHETAWIALFDEASSQLANTRYPDRRGARRGDPDRVPQVIASGRASVTDLALGGISRTPIIAVDVPFTLAGQGYVVTQAFLPEYFNRAFAEMAIPEGWLVGIFDSKGLTIARSRRAAEFVGKPASPRLVEAMGKAREGALRHVTRDDLEVYDFFTRPRMAEWRVAVGIPVDVLEANARRAVITAAAGILLALAAAALLAWLVGRRLVNAIAVTERAAQAVGRGGVPVASPTCVAEVDGLQRTLAGAAQQLEEARAEREAAEAERVRLLESEQQARKYAEAQNLAKDEFLAMLGHELRNPLSAISGAIAVMQSPAATHDTSQRARGVIARQSAHLARIVDDLLDVSRVMTGKIHLDLQRVDLAEAARRCVQTMGAAGKSARHEVTVETESAWIDADTTRLDQVICNLLANAFKYTPEGGHVRVRVRPDDGHATLEVADDGIGIEPALLPRIFDIFVQGAASLDRGDGGLGLGLALVQRLVHMHGGNVAAESAGRGKGSRFVLTFPRLAPPERREESAAAQAAAGARILVVDDHADARAMLRMMLELLGHAVTEAGDGVAAIETARNEAFDLALVDIGLPGIDGYEVARRLRADATTRALPLIALTGYGQDEDRRRALDAGFDEHLVKPVEPRSLEEAIARFARAAR